MMDSVTIFAALSMGFLGSLHCAGMCGPIMLILPFQLHSGLKKAVAIGLYHFGRISVYATMGLILHSFKAFFHPQYQQYISMALGGLLLVAGLLTFITKSVNLPALPWLQFVKKQSVRFIGRPELGSLFIAGILNGLLPCGLVYMALSLAATASSPATALIEMYAFGFGTLPMLLAITLFKGRVKFLRTTSIRKYVPVIMLAFGSLFLVRGMNLGIPYLSPQVSIEHQVIRNSCCHK